jgi:hypothetical protein
VGCNFQGIADTASLPNHFEGLSAYPNPFNQSVKISYTIPKAGVISINIFNISGQLITELTSGYQNAGYNTILWNASGCTSGIYFVALASAINTQTIKIILLK